MTCRPPKHLARPDRNSDRLTLTRILRQAAEGCGNEWLTYVQRRLFEPYRRARDYLLETDAWGNFMALPCDGGGRPVYPSAKRA